MRVLLLTHFLSSSGGGIPPVIKVHAEELGKQGFDVRVAGCCNELWEDEKENWEHLDVVPLLASGPRHLSWFPTLSRIIRHFSPHLIHIHGLWKLHILTTLRSVSPSIPIVVNPHGMLEPWALRQSVWQKRIIDLAYQRRLFHRASAAVALSEAEKSQIKTRYSETREIIVIPNGIDLPAIETETSSSTKHTREKRILFLGRLHEKKGLLPLIDGWAKFIRQSSDGETWNLGIAGWGTESFESKVRCRVRELGLTSLVSFLGRVSGEDKEKLLRQADAFILPSFSEGFPVAILEAWRYGLPILMTEACHIESGFQEKAAIKIEATSADIARGLLRLADLPEDERIAMGQRGRRLVESRFSREKIGKQLAALYSDLHTRSRTGP